MVKCTSKAQLGTGEADGNQVLAIQVPPPRWPIAPCSCDLPGVPYIWWVNWRLMETKHLLWQMSPPLHPDSGLLTLDTFQRLISDNKHFLWRREQDLSRASVEYQFSPQFLTELLIWYRPLYYPYFSHSFRVTFSSSIYGMPKGQPSIFSHNS